LRPLFFRRKKPMFSEDLAPMFLGWDPKRNAARQFDQRDSTLGKATAFLDLSFSANHVSSLIHVRGISPAPNFPDLNLGLTAAPVTLLFVFFAMSVLVKHNVYRIGWLRNMLFFTSGSCFSTESSYPLVFVWG
jgi:hypothetical protein